MSTAPSGSAKVPLSSQLRPFRGGLYFGFFNAITWQVALGTPMILYLERLGATTAAVGLAYSFVFLMTPLQVMGTTLLSRLGFKKLMLLAWTSRGMFLFYPVILAWSAPSRNETWMLTGFLLSLLFFCLFRALGNCAYMPWLYSILPAPMRGKYLATEQVYSGVSSVLTLLLSAAVFLWLGEYSALGILYTLALAGSFLSAFALAKLPSAPPPESLGMRQLVHAVPRLVSEAGPFRRFLVLSLLMATVSTGMVPFLVYYLKTDLSLPASQILVFTVLQYSGVIIGNLLIRGWVDRTGPKPYFLLSFLLYGMVGAFWIVFLPRADAGIALMPGVFFLLGMAASFWICANLNYLPQICPEQNRPLSVAVYGAVTSLWGGVCPIVLGFFLRPATGAQGMNLEVFLVYFLLLVLVMAGLTILFLRMTITGTEQAPVLIGAQALRPFRGVAHLAGLDVRPSSRETENQPR